jgi:hypothetical protein
VLRASFGSQRKAGSFSVLIRNPVQTYKAIGLYAILKFINYLQAQAGNVTTRSGSQMNLLGPASLSLSLSHTHFSPRIQSSDRTLKTNSNLCHDSAVVLNESCGSFMTGEWHVRCKTSQILWNLTESTGSVNICSFEKYIYPTLF